MIICYNHNFYHTEQYALPALHDDVCIRYTGRDRVKASCMGMGNTFHDFLHCVQRHDNFYHHWALLNANYYQYSRVMNASRHALLRTKL